MNLRLTVPGALQTNKKTNVSFGYSKGARTSKTNVSEVNVSEAQTSDWQDLGSLHTYPQKQTHSKRKPQTVEFQARYIHTHKNKRIQSANLRLSSSRLATYIHTKTNAFKAQTSDYQVPGSPHTYTQKQTHSKHKSQPVIKFQARLGTYRHSCMYRDRQTHIHALEKQPQSVKFQVRLSTYTLMLRRSFIL